MLLNGILFNSEIWYNVKEEEVKKLSQVDEYLLRSILGAPSKTPKEALYLETGCVPIKFILKMRRLMYLHHILSRPQEELIRKFYEAQKCKMSKGDWAKTAEENLKELKMKMTDEKISQISKHKFKRILKKNIYKEAFDELIEKKDSHSKMSETKYDKLEPQSYLKSDSGLSNEEKYLLMKFRTRMAELRNNFQNKYQDQLCQLCKAEVEDQSHLFRCDALINKCEALAENIEVEYEDIFSHNSKQQAKAVKLLSKMWETRENLIQKED